MFINITISKIPDIIMYLYVVKVVENTRSKIGVRFLGYYFVPKISIDYRMFNSQIIM